jgi:broad specificity phosphatase PhoE
MEGRNIYITRHGQRIDFVDQSWVESHPEYSHDPPLSEIGFSQAQELGQFCKNKNITRIVSSPYLRCLQTAFMVAKEINAPDSNAVKTCVEPGCQEFHGLKKAWTLSLMPRWYFYHDRRDYLPDYEQELSAILPYIDLDYKPLYSEDEYFLKRGSPDELNFVETREQLEQRLLRIFEHTIHDPDPKNHNVLFVTHAAGLISSVEALMRRRHPDMRTGVCGLTTVLFDPDTKTYELVTSNDCSFLKLGEMHHWAYPEPN